MIPLNNLTSSLFQNYNEQTSMVLLSIFKIFHTAIYFHLPEVIEVNMHSWMIFIKKILDLKITAMQPLKRLCLKILARLYSKHANKQINPKPFSRIFHEKYSQPIVETLILQVLSKHEGNNMEQLEIISLALAPLPNIFHDH